MFAKYMRISTTDTPRLNRSSSREISEAGWLRPRSVKSNNAGTSSAMTDRINRLDCRPARSRGNVCV